MSKLNELKKQYPELNITIIDMLSKVDNTKSHKYLPLLCKLFRYRFNLNENFRGNTRDIKNEIKYIRERLSNIFDVENLTDNEVFILEQFVGFYNTSDLETIKQFKDYNERNLISNKDVTSYKNLDEVLQAVSLAEIRSIEKEMEKQVIKEFEDNTWLLVRPLTFSSSLRYGSSTKWCTTYKHEKQYFERYWKRGILVYCINKITGYKFAIFKSLDGEPELSFWNAADRRIDFLELEIEDYMYPIIKDLLKSKQTNRDLCDTKTELSVIMECSNQLKKLSTLEDEIRLSFTNEDRYETQPPITDERPVMEYDVREVDLREMGGIPLGGRG
jgi:hypothetical protein